MQVAMALRSHDRTDHRPKIPFNVWHTKETCSAYSTRLVFIVTRRTMTLRSSPGCYTSATLRLLWFLYSNKRNGSVTLHTRSSVPARHGGDCAGIVLIPQPA